MKIRMKADISGSRNGRPWPRRGGTVDLPDSEAADLCEAGLAEPVAAREQGVEQRPAPQTGVEQRSADDDTVQARPVTTQEAPALAKKAPAAPRKTAAKKTAAKPEASGK